MTILLCLLLFSGSELVDAALRGDLEAVKANFRGVVDAETCHELKGLELNFPDILFDETVCGNALMAAAASGHQEVVAWLIEQRFPLDVVQNNGLRALDLAVAANQPITLRLLLTARADHNRSGFFLSPIEVAAMSDLWEVAKLLLEFGVELDDGPIPSLVFPLDRENAVQWVTSMVEHGADPNAVFDFGGSVLEMAASESNLESVQALLDSGASLSKFGVDALLVSINRNEKLAMSLVNAGVPVNKPDRWGQLPLHVAISRNQHDLARFFVEQGAGVQQKDALGRTALMYARENIAAEWLLKKGAHKETTDRNGYTALLHWIWNREFELVFWALKEDFNPNQASNFGETPLLIAKLADWEPLSRALEQQLVVMSADQLMTLQFVNALRARQKSAINLPSQPILKSGYFVRQIFIPTLMASDDDLLTPLLDKGLDAQLMPFKTLLIDLMGELNGSQIRRLVRAGWNVNEKDREGNTALMTACDQFHLDAVETLIKLKADVNAQNTFGETALHKSVYFRIFLPDDSAPEYVPEHYQVIRALLQAGADPNIPNLLGMDLSTQIKVFGNCHDCELLDLIDRYR